MEKKKKKKNNASNKKWPKKGIWLAQFSLCMELEKDISVAVWIWRGKNKHLYVLAQKNASPTFRAKEKKCLPYLPSIEAGTLVRATAALPQPLRLLYSHRFPIGRGFIEAGG